MLLFPHLEVYSNWQNQPQNKPMPECTGWRTGGGKAPPSRREQMFQRESRVLKHSIKSLQELSDTAGREEPGRLSHILSFSLTQTAQCSTEPQEWVLW